MPLYRGGPARVAGVVGIVLSAALCLAPAAQAQTTASSAAEQAISFEVPAGALSTALTEFARQSGQELFYLPDMAEGKNTSGVSGIHDRERALAILLQGTGLDFERAPTGAMLIGDQASLAELRAEIQARQNGAHAGNVSGGADELAAAVVNAPAPASVQVGRQDGIEEIIVTGQKREERIQDVPIAISAFSMENLDNQKIEGGFDLLKAVPNVTFSKSNFSGYNFQIRGIGTQAISATTDPGVAVSFNNTTLIVNRLFEQEYLDIERVEVLRGPQGTLFGRNATAGVINVITAKPEMGYYGGEIKLETGNYNAQRARGHINVPLGNSDTLAARLAFAMTKRDGYGRNLAASDPEVTDFIREFNRAPISDDIDNRDLWTGRASIGWQPNDQFRANLIYERFEEDDRRMRSTKQLCHHDDGEVTLYRRNGYEDDNGVPVPISDPIMLFDSIKPQQKNNVRFPRYLQTVYRGQLTQGCKPGSLFDAGDITAGQHGAYGTPNGNAIPFVRAGRGLSFVIGEAPFPSDPSCSSDQLVSDCALDPLAAQGGQSRDLRSIFSLLDPRYQALSEVYDLSFDYELSAGLTLSSQTVYAENELFSTQDFLRFKTLPTFGDSSNSPNHRRLASPLGVVNDPQLGPSDRLLMQDVSQQTARQFSQEFRLSSSFDGPLNYSIGVNYTRFETVTDYFVFINALSALVYGGNVYSGVPFISSFWGDPDYALVGGADPTNGNMNVGCGPHLSQVEKDLFGNIRATCIYVQPGGIEEVRNDPEGHNFFLSRNPYELDAASIFSEVYYEVSPTLKLTAGLRFNWDRKTFTPVPSQTMLADWRGRLQGGTLFDFYSVLPAGASVGPLCDPRLAHLGQGHISGIGQVPCALSGLAENGRGYPALPDVVQEWRVPTGRLGFDWKLDLGVGWIDESLVYLFYTRGYKAGGANPPMQSAPSGLLLAAAQGAAAPPLFKAEYVNALELGTKNRLLGGSVSLGGTAFYYDYKDYQISKILDRSANNENVDAVVWGLELEATFAPATDTLLNASVGYLRTRIADGEESLDLMDRTQGGNQHYVDPAWAAIDCNIGGNATHIACLNDGVDGNGNVQYRYRHGFDQWVLIRPTLTQASSCIAPAVLIYEEIQNIAGQMADDLLSQYCPGGRLITGRNIPRGYSPFTSAPNSAAGFLADVGGNELPNAPRFTVSLGAQQTYWFRGGNWSATGRVDWYWQDKSYHRIYNTEYDRLNDWTNTNLSIWLNNDRLGLTIEAYAKNIFDEAPITGAFLNSDDTGLSTNVFTLDPRLIGLTIRKRF